MYEKKQKRKKKKKRATKEFERGNTRYGTVFRERERASVVSLDRFRVRSSVLSHTLNA